jgi:hypothetical protein
MSFNYTPVVTFYEDDMLPFLLMVSWNYLLLLLFCLHNNLPHRVLPIFLCEENSTEKLKSVSRDIEQYFEQDRMLLTFQVIVKYLS